MKTREKQETKKGTGCIGCLTLIVIFVVIGIINSLINPNDTSTESTTQQTISEVSSTTENSTTDKKAELEKREKKSKKNAKAMDKKIWNIVQEVDTSMSDLFTELRKFSDDPENANISTLYDAAKQANEDLDTCLDAANEIASESYDLYSNSLTFYVMNRQDIAQNLIWYIDNQDEKYMETVEERMDNANQLTIDLLKERSNYLEDNGFTDEEIVKILDNK